MSTIAIRKSDEAAHAAIKNALTKGDSPGHEFRGNQYSSAAGVMDAKIADAKSKIAREKSQHANGGGEAAHRAAQKAHTEAAAAHQEAAKGGPIGHHMAQAAFHETRADYHRNRGTIAYQQGRKIAEGALAKLRSGKPA